MKLNQKYRHEIRRPDEYIKLANALFNISRLQNKIVPESLELESSICGDMVEIQCMGKPPFFAGACTGDDLALDQTFAESLGLDLHRYLKSR